MTQTMDTLRRQAARRWQEIEAERPDLAEAVRLQRLLVGRIIELVKALAGDRSLVGPSAARAHESLKAGRPFLRGELPAVPVHLLSPAILAFCADLADAGAGDAARHVREVLSAGRIDVASLLRASLDRQTTAIRNGATQQGLSADLLWLVAELGAGPVAHVLQRRVFADLSSGSAQAGGRTVLAIWGRGDCPACGSWPALAEGVAGTAWLRCSFCGAAWRLATERCPYCSAAGKTLIDAAPDLDRPRRLRLCGACGGYLKSIDVATATPFELLPIEDLATTDLDVGAMERGYHRPALPETPDVGETSFVRCPEVEPAAPHRTP